jgi:trehalose-6-phosphate synthase
MNHVADTRMKLFTFLPLVLSMLAGCASPNAPETRPYTAEETKELALEALNRRSMNFEEYHHRKNEILNGGRIL